MPLVRPGDGDTADLSRLAHGHATDGLAHGHGTDGAGEASVVPSIGESAGTDPGSQRARIVLEGETWSALTSSSVL